MSMENLHALLVSHAGLAERVGRYDKPPRR